MSKPKLDGEDEYFVMMPAWESVKECPKCGEERAQSQRQAAPPQSPHGWWTETVSVVSGGFKYEYVTDATDDRRDLIPHKMMLVTCPRCGHNWYEQPKDAGG